MPFEDRYTKGAPDACWIWTGRPGNHGYGRYGKKRVLAHRIAYEREYGPIEDRMCVLHRCDTPLCVNPSHLFLGTRIDNAADRDAKRRQPTCEEHPAARLSRKDVDTIRRRHKAGETYVKLAEDYGVDFSHIGRIVRRERWKDQPAEVVTARM